MTGIILFVVAFILLMLGIPVAFAFGASAIFAALLDPNLGLEVFGLLPYRIYGIMQNFTLMAVPLFIFMGFILEKSKIAENMLEAIGKLFGPVRGGLAIAIVIVGAILAASTGIVGASVVMMTIISLPVMLKYGYSPRLASGVIAASGTLGQLIPPSIVLIILGAVMQISVGDLFKAAIIPGLIIVGLYIIYILVIAFIKPEVAPAIKTDEPYSQILLQALKSLVAPFILIALVLGSIFAGFATPTESAAIGALGAIILTFFYGTFNLELLRYASVETVKITAMIFMILIGATAFSLVFNESGAGDIVTEFFTDSISNQYIFIAITMILIFILGFFIDFIEITFIVIPILLPIVEEFNIDPLWFALLIAINLQTSFLTPPFGFSLFYLKGAAGDMIKTSDLYKGIIPFIIIQLIALLIVLFEPKLVYLLVK
ncbi:TRAP transporter large permease [Caminibacter pacificus]|jgi:tripartite ATP-independent transporter DctM subunit|uniref:TRAP transporter large permease subunit n=1 Tax=Caminibacter pacificus TaxID=1424653 RepID=A0AAJ4RDT6_9BACT|nr:TRAP transporter large permease subunit [Caminibacter pacificus]QCI28357.1 TRAP transporter large permease subunit [Caminibacter pacificus]ROR40922.1 tripartite ATP-independent transporter DctM subunit [Caminibacter pacificus]